MLYQSISILSKSFKSTHVPSVDSYLIRDEYKFNVIISHYKLLCCTVYCYSLTYFRTTPNGMIGSYYYLQNLNLGLEGVSNSGNIWKSSTYTHGSSGIHLEMPDEHMWYYSSGHKNCM